MVVDFAKVNVKEQPLLILQNMDDTPIGVLALDGKSQTAYHIHIYRPK